MTYMIQTTIFVFIDEVHLSQVAHARKYRNNSAVHIRLDELKRAKIIDTISKRIKGKHEDPRYRLFRHRMALSWLYSRA